MQQSSIDPLRRELSIAFFALAAAGGSASRVSAAAPTPTPAPTQGAAPSRTSTHTPPSAQSLANPSRVLRVGPQGTITRIAEAARLARDGDIVEIEPGDYVGDVAVWRQERLTIRSARDSRRTDPPGADAPPVRLLAAGRAAEAKAIWVIRHGVFEIEGIEFHGARVPDRNGAGIRFEGGHLAVRDCRFVDNETGILTGNDADAELLVERCEFAGRALTDPGGRFSHNLYVGAIGRFEMRGCWSHHANLGHLVKTRARESHLLCNRLTDEAGGRASYELDCPNGGVLVAVGNLIVQEPTTDNRTIVAYGAEGYRWPANRLVLSHNTLVTRAGIATFVRAHPGASVDAFVANNLFVGEGVSEGIGAVDGAGNRYASLREFRDPTGFDFSLRDDSALRGRAVALAAVGVPEAIPTAEYAHPLALRRLSGVGVLAPGAFQQ